MDIIKTWNDVSENIGFYTKETSFNIPESPGIYAWFIPLWLYNDDVYELIKFVKDAMLYDSDIKQRNKPFQGSSERESKIDFNWDYIDIKLKKNHKLRSKGDIDRWATSDNNKEEYASISESLMKASIFAKPIYIGRADSLSSRYSQHVSGTVEKNVFNTRFKEFTQESNVKLNVDDLLFACIPISQKSNAVLKDRDLTTVLESILMNLVHPSFSCK